MDSGPRGNDCLRRVQMTPVPNCGLLGHIASSRSHLAALRAVKHTPYREILGNVIELMFDSRSHKQEVARLKRVPFAIMNKHSSTANDEVNLVLRVRRLLARAHREGEGYIQRTTPKDADGVLTRRYLRSGLSNAENKTMM